MTAPPEGVCPAPGCGQHLPLTPGGLIPRHYAAGLTHIWATAKRCRGSREKPGEPASATASPRGSTA